MAEIIHSFIAVHQCASLCTGDTVHILYYTTLLFPWALLGAVHSGTSDKQ